MEGPGQIWCLDSGSPTNHDIGMRADNIQAYNGMSLAYVRARKPGRIKLIVRGDHIAPSGIVIEALD